MCGQSDVLLQNLQPCDNRVSIITWILLSLGLLIKSGLYNHAHFEAKEEIEAELQTIYEQVDEGRRTRFAINKLEGEQYYNKSFYEKFVARSKVTLSAVQMDDGRVEDPEQVLQLANGHYKDIFQGGETRASDPECDALFGGLPKVAELHNELLTKDILVGESERALKEMKAGAAPGSSRANKG